MLPRKTDVKPELSRLFFWRSSTIESSPPPCYTPGMCETPFTRVPGKPICRRPMIRSGSRAVALIVLEEYE